MANKKRSLLARQAKPRQRAGNPLICGTYSILHICKQRINKASVFKKSFATFSKVYGDCI